MAVEYSDPSWASPDAIAASVFQFSCDVCHKGVRLGGISLAGAGPKFDGKYCDKCGRQKNRDLIAATCVGCGGEAEPVELDDDRQVPLCRDCYRRSLPQKAKAS